MFLGLYVDVFVYFSPSKEAELAFEKKMSSLTKVDFMGQVSHFLGIEFMWQKLPDDNLCVSLTQQSFVESLLDSLNISYEGTSIYTSPYQSGIHIDSIPSIDMSSVERDKLRLQYQYLVGSLNWLAHTTRPDLSTIVSLLAQYQAVLLLDITMLLFMSLNIYLH